MSQQQLHKIVTDSQQENELPRQINSHKNSDEKSSSKAKEEYDNSSKLQSRERFEQRPPFHQEGFLPPPPYIPPYQRFVPPAMLPKPKNLPEIQIIKNRLYFYSGQKPPASNTEAYFFSVDDELQYDPFNEDFGPLSLAQIHKYIRELVRLMIDQDYKNVKLYHYCSHQYDKLANSCFLMGCFMMVVLQMKSEKVVQIFEPYLNGIIIPYRDASYGDCFYQCTIEQCWQGLEFAMKLGWYKFGDFDNKEYEYYEKLENGDLNWIIPGKFMAFMGPLDDPPLAYNGIDRMGNTPDDYIQVFKHFNVTRVIRLNEPKYDKQVFIDGQISHSDLYFIDGSVPPANIVEEFLKIAESEPGAMAVHCKAGLGRTGTLIALYAMKHYHFPAAAFIGWIRIARPGSILGPQQFYLVDMEEVYLGKQNTQQNKNRGQQRKTEMSPIDLRKSQFGDKNQGDHLNQRKYASPTRHSNPPANIVNQQLGVNLGNKLNLGANQNISRDSRKNQDGPVGELKSNSYSNSYNQQFQ